MLRVVAFDMDGVLTKCRSSWRALHLHFGSMSIIDELRNADKFRNGDIDYKEWMRLDTEAILKAAGGKVRKEEIERVLLSLEIDEDASKVVAHIKSLGLKTAIVSGGIDILANHIGKILGIDYVYANKLLFDDNGYLLPGGVEVVNPLKKGGILRELSSLTGIPLKKFMYVGDSEWDLNAFKTVGYPVLLKRDDLNLKVPGLIVIGKLGELIEVIDRICMQS
jgi:phosphoserine phosphatase